MLKSSSDTSMRRGRIIWLKTYQKLTPQEPRIAIKPNLQRSKTKPFAIDHRFLGFGTPASSSENK